MKKKIKISPKGRISVNWKVTPYDYSKDKEKDIKAKLSSKYGIDKNRIKVVPQFVMVSENGEEMSIEKDIITNINDPNFQTSLFKEYVAMNNIEGCDFDMINKIDSEMNGLIDYDSYDKFRRFSIKWVKWDNFMSYGQGNQINFSELNGLTLLNGKNQAGKTTISNDLIHFLLFGTTSKAKTQDKIFNRYLNEETNVTVEGCINIEGEDYIIKRVLSRPSAERRTSKSKVSQKVEYYRVVGGEMQELSDGVEDKNGESSVQTNKIIKESIGNESDFNLMVSVTDATLDELINKKETERGRLLSRWIGLLPIEEKEKVAKETFNQQIKPYLISNRYNAETLKNEIMSLKANIEAMKKSNKAYSAENKSLESEITTLEKTKETLLASKMTVDESLLKVDITTLTKKMENVMELGKQKSTKITEIDKELKEIGEVDFSVAEYDANMDKLSKLNSEKGSLASDYKHLKTEIEHLKKSEFCPTCGKKLDNVDNSVQISAKEALLKEVSDKGKSVAEQIGTVSAVIDKMKSNRDKYNRKSAITTERTALELNVERLRNEWKEYNATLKEYKKNSETIDRNNQISMQIRNNDSLLLLKRKTKESNLMSITENDMNIKKSLESIDEKEKMIVKIQEEEKVIRHWKIYMDLVGKNGISKMVLRRALPIINAKLREVLSDVCDFDVEVNVTEKNDVIFNIIKDGVVDDLGSGSGFELTAASLALRFVLSSLSTIPRLNYVTLDEIWGRVEEANYDNIHALLDKMLNDYDFILLVSHQDMIKNWCEKSLIAEKKDNVSTIRIATAKEK